jgi:hypothetical protein
MNTTRCPLASSSVAPTSRSSRELRAPRRTARPADCSLVIEAQVSADIWLTLALDDAQQSASARGSLFQSARSGSRLVPKEPPR